MNTADIVLFESADGAVTLPVEVDISRNEVWLTRQQLALLFDRDVKTIGKHVGNALKEELLGDRDRVVAKPFASLPIHFAFHAQRRQVKDHHANPEKAFLSQEPGNAIGQKISWAPLFQAGISPQRDCMRHIPGQGRRHLLYACKRSSAHFEISQRQTRTPAIFSKHHMDARGICAGLA